MQKKMDFLKSFFFISGRCTGLHGIAPSPSQQLSRPSSATVASDLGGRGDFHYNVEPVYRRPRDLTSSYHHSSRASSGGGSQSDAYSDYAYLEHKASPYHTGMYLKFILKFWWFPLGLGQISGHL